MEKKGEKIMQLSEQKPKDENMGWTKHKATKQLFGSVSTLDFIEKFEICCYLL